MRTDLPTLDTATPPDGLPLYLEIRWYAEKVRRDGSGYGPGIRTWLEWAASASAMLTEQEGLISALARRSAERDEARKERDAALAEVERVRAERDTALANADRLHRTLAVVLARFTEPGHLGAAGDCLRTGWVQARTVDTWRELVEVTRG